MIPNKLAVSTGFTIRGRQIPPFELTAGKLVRIYIPNFSLLHEFLGIEVALELVELFAKRKEVAGLIVSSAIPYARNYQPTPWERIFRTKTAEDYLKSKFGATPNQVITILAQLDIKPGERMGSLGLCETKALTMKGLFLCSEVISFDYYGIGAGAIDKLDSIVNQFLSEGKSAIGFDNLEFLEQVEPYDNFQRVIINPG